MNGGRTRVLRTALAATGTAAGVVVALAVTASAAAAQASTSTRAAASGTRSDIGGFVFLGVMAVILGTALILYLRHRTPKAQREAAAAAAADRRPGAPGRPDPR